MIAVNKLFTAFDETNDTVLYINQPFKSHRLMQAIARISRLLEKNRIVVRPDQS